MPHGSEASEPSGRDNPVSQRGVSLCCIYNYYMHKRHAAYDDWRSSLRDRHHHAATIGPMRLVVTVFKKNGIACLRLFTKFFS